MALSDDPSSLDPWYADDEVDLALVDALHDGLVVLELSGRVAPALAETWWFGGAATPLVDPADDPSDLTAPRAPVLDADGLLAPDDGTLLTFRLRADARFHDGTRVTAVDVVRGLRGLLERPDGQRAPYGYLLDVLRAEDGTAPSDAVTVLDDRHVRLRARRPAVGLLELLAHPAVAPRHPEAPDGEDLMPIGSGPFALAQEPVPDEFVRVRRHADWGRGPATDGGPWLDEVVFRVYTGDETRQAQYADLLEGRVDVAAVPATRRAQARLRLGLSPHPNRGPGLVAGPTATTWSYGFDLSDEEVWPAAARATVRAAVDAEELADGLLDGSRVPLHGVLSPGIPGARADACGTRCELPDDPRAAADAVPTPVVVVHDAGPPQDTVAAIAARQLRETLDIDAASRAVPADDYLMVLLDAPPPGPFRLAWEPDVPTAGAVLTPRFHSRELGGNNLVRFADPVVDDLLDRADRAPDLTTRQALLHAVEDVLLDRAVLVPLLADRIDLGVVERVHGLVVDALGRVDLTGAWLEALP